jgi:anti-sigma factor RsiW
MSTDRLHREAWELLPWYVNGTLENPELDAVQAHLGECEACREEAARCRQLAVAVQAASPGGRAPSPERLARLLERIDRTERTAGGPAWRRWLGGTAARLRDALRTTAPPIRWVLAAQGALVVLLAAWGIWQAAAGGAPAYRTLADPSDPPGAVQARIRLVFADDTPERDIRALLRRIDGSIVAGPSLAGAYTVELADAAARPAALDTLRASPGVRLAEPVLSR